MSPTWKYWMIEPANANDLATRASLFNTPVHLVCTHTYITHMHNTKYTPTLA